MDNITHTLTGAIASKTGPERHHTRLLFWIMVVSANLPDIDFVLQFFGDRIFYMEHHRGLSHSFVFAPFFAAFVAGIIKLTVKGLQFRLVFTYVLLGIVIHIFFDLITSFGTMIFYPLTETRYTLDLIFIIDPWLTGSMVLLLVIGRTFRHHRKKVVWGGLAFIALYFALAVVNREVVRSKAGEYFTGLGIEYERMIVLPQPFAITNWMVAVETDEAAYQLFTTSFQKTGNYEVLEYPLIEPNQYIYAARNTDEVDFFKWFARMPVYDYYKDENGKHVVEYYDLQFIFNPRLADRLNVPSRAPFVLRLTFDDTVRLIATDF
jgi:inner membrane protein